MACAQVAPHIPITYCPPMPARNAWLDEYVGARRHMPVGHAIFDSYGDASSNGIDWADFGRMGTLQHKLDRGRVAKPSWPMNDLMLRKTLIRFLECRAGFKEAQPGSDIERLRRAEAALNQDKVHKEILLNNLVKIYVSTKRIGGDVKKLGEEIENLDTTLLITNGIAGKVLRIVHLYYRHGLNSVEVATEVGLKPPHIRRTLMRMRIIAAQLGFGEAPRRQGRRSGKEVTSITEGISRRCEVQAVSLQPEPPATGGCEMKRLLYADAIKTVRFQRALAKSIAAKPEKTRCSAGHDLVNAEEGHIHVGDLLRLGQRNCRTCWKKQNAAYTAKKAKATKKGSKK